MPLWSYLQYSCCRWQIYSCVLNFLSSPHFYFPSPLCPGPHLYHVPPFGSTFLPPASPDLSYFHILSYFACFHLLFLPASQDYNPLPTTTITFNSATTSRSVPVTIINDNRAEGLENFTATLSAVPAADRFNIAPDVALVEISDDDSE